MSSLPIIGAAPTSRWHRPEESEVVVRESGDPGRSEVSAADHGEGVLLTADVTQREGTVVVTHHPEKLVVEGSRKGPNKRETSEML